MIGKPHGKHKHCHPMDVNKVIAEPESEERAREAGDEANKES